MSRDVAKATSLFHNLGQAIKSDLARVEGGTHDAPPSATEPDGVDKESVLCPGVNYWAKSLACDGFDVRFTGASVPCLGSERDAFEHS